MVVARIFFKNKSGWSTCGPAFRKAETMESLQKFAEQKAKGREFQIQTDESYSRYEQNAKEVEA